MVADNFFQNDIILNVRNSSHSEYVDKKVHANKFKKDMGSSEIFVRQVDEIFLVVYDDQNNFIEGNQV